MKKAVTKVVHQVVKLLRAEEIFVALAKLHPIFTKCIPAPSEYRDTETRSVKRDNTRYKVALFDYMQWTIFADLPDQSWRCATEYLKPGAQIFDIGANCGHFCLKVASYAASNKVAGITVHAFEPNPIVFQALSNNKKLNKGAKNTVTLYQMALGEKSESRSFHFNHKNLGGGRISDSSSGGIMVNVSTLDSVVAETKLDSVDFIKLDVEGFEPFVLAGGWQTITRFKPAIFMEVTPTWYESNGHTATAVLQRLIDLGYVLFEDEETNLVPFDITRGSTKFQFNIFARQAIAETR